MEQVAVAMALLQLLEFFLVFSDHPWIVYVWHGFIVPLTNLIGITTGWRRLGYFGRVVPWRRENTGR